VYVETGHERWSSEELPQVVAHEGKEPHTLVELFVSNQRREVRQMDVAPSLTEPGGFTQAPFLLISSSTDSPEDSPAKTSASPVDEPDSKVASAPAFSSSSHVSPTTLFGPEGMSSLRTYPDYFPPRADEISPSFSRRWPSSGFTIAPGECWTADTSECPSGGGVSSSFARRARGRRCAEILLEPEGGGGNPAAGGGEGADASYASLSGIGSGGPDDNDGQAGRVIAVPISGDALREGVAKTPSPDAEGKVRLRDPGLGVGDGGEPSFTITGAAPGAVAVIADTLTSGSHPGSNMPGLRREDDTNIVVANTLKGQRGKGGGGLGPEETLIAPTLSEDSAEHLGAVRRLTPVECERLQGLPDGWTDVPAGKAPDSRRYAGVGDAVTVNVGEWIGRRLLDIEDEHGA
jgi:hypothetical protein